MTAATYDFNIEQGTDWHLDFNLDTDSGSGATDADITNVDFLASMRPQHATGPAHTISITKLNRSEGRFRIHQSTATTNGIPAGSYKYDIEATFNDPLQPVKTIRLLEGTITVRAQATR